jgi:hypothetical protein
MSEGIYNNRQDKFFATQKPDNLEVNDVARVNAHKLCNCPGSEPGKIIADIGAHKHGCHIRRRLQTGRYTINISVTPKKISDGYGLGLVLGEENF